MQDKVIIVIEMVGTRKPRSPAISRSFAWRQSFISVHQLSAMESRRVFWIAAILLVAVALVSACTTSMVTTPLVPATPAPTTVSGAGFLATPVTDEASGIDTVVPVRFNDFACLSVQEELGREYLYPDEKYTLLVSPPEVSGVNVNILFVDENDSLKLRQITPTWDTVQKKWLYEGIVPLAQFQDITTPAEKTISIKTQSKYYICIDDRKETGVNDVMLQVPVRLRRV